MQDLPHHYRVAATAQPQGEVALATDGVDDLMSAAPVEFGGPGGHWSPETLLVAAVADCFVLSFRAIARASKLPWIGLQCAVEGTLARSDGKTRFTEFAIKATLDVAPDVDPEQARRLLEKAEASCLITNSLSGTTHLTALVSCQPG